MTSGIVRFVNITKIRLIPSKPNLKLMPAIGIQEQSKTITLGKPFDRAGIKTINVSTNPTKDNKRDNCHLNNLFNSKETAKQKAG